MPVCRTFVHKQAFLWYNNYKGKHLRERVKDMAKYITEMERYRIEFYLKENKNPRWIAEKLGRHYTTIYAEKRKGTVELKNSDLTYRKEYCADAAQRKTTERSHNKGRDLKIGSDLELVHRLEYLIGTLHYSPYAAVQTIRKEGIYKTDICKGTVYNYIDKGIFLNISNKDLYIKRSKKKQVHHEVTGRPAHKHINVKSINDRPASADGRNEFGHWEMDTVYSGRNKSKACLLEITERMTRDQYIIRMPDRTLPSVVHALDTLEKSMGARAFRETFKTITVDNGSEFGDGTAIEKSCQSEKPRTAVYFCHPYSSWERGSNENQNRLTRYWIPKGEDIAAYTDEQVRSIQDWINNYPRAMFGGLSTNEYKQKLGII